MMVKIQVALNIFAPLKHVYQAVSVLFAKMKERLKFVRDCLGGLLSSPDLVLLLCLSHL